MQTFGLVDFIHTSFSESYFAQLRTFLELFFVPKRFMLDNELLLCNCLMKPLGLPTTKHILVLLQDALHTELAPSHSFLPIWPSFNPACTKTAQAWSKFCGHLRPKLKHVLWLRDLKAQQNRFIKRNLYLTIHLNIYKQYFFLFYRNQH